MLSKINCFLNTKEPKQFKIIPESLRTRATIYDNISSVYPTPHLTTFKHLRQKHSAARRILNSLTGVWKCGQTRSFVFDISS